MCVVVFLYLSPAIRWSTPPLSEGGGDGLQSLFSGIKQLMLDGCFCLFIYKISSYDIEQGPQHNLSSSSSSTKLFMPSGGMVEKRLMSFIIWPCGPDLTLMAASSASHNFDTPGVFSELPIPLLLRVLEF